MIEPPWSKPAVPTLRLGVAKAEPVPLFDDARFKLDAELFKFNAELFRFLSQHPFRHLDWTPIGGQKT